MIRNSKGVIVAGMQSSSGKTAVTCMLLAALRARGAEPRPFKVGPDFIDTGYHARYAGMASRNLDAWMMGRDRILSEAAANTVNGIGVVEGVMGLFDGGSAGSDEGSAMELARWLDWPVLLVVPAAKTGRSLAAALRGFIEEAGKDRICGIILNQVSGSSHVDFLREAIAPLNVPVLGALPQCDALKWPERHLGLQSDVELPLPSASDLAKLAEENLDLDAIISCVSAANGFHVGIDSAARKGGASLRIALARDEAFHFYYAANLDFLREQGQIIEFSPLHDATIPSNAEAVVFGGGFPEIFAEQLADNASMRASVHSAISGGLPCYAECGGLMYLANELVSHGGTHHPMAGVIPGSVEMTPRLVNFGYCEAGLHDATFRGHEFHYSRWSGEETRANLWDVTKRRGGKTRREGFGTENLHASYVHLYWRNSARIFQTLFQKQLEPIA